MSARSSRPSPAAVAAPELDNAKTKQVGELDIVSIGTNRIDRFLAILPKRNGSDLHLSVGSPPIVRIDGELERIRYRVLTEGDFYNLIGPITPPRIWEAFSETATSTSPTRWATRRAIASISSARNGARPPSSG